MPSSPNDGGKVEKIDDEAGVDVVQAGHGVADVLPRNDQHVTENVDEEVTGNKNVDVKTDDNRPNDVMRGNNDCDDKANISTSETGVETNTNDPEETVAKTQTECDANNDQIKTTALVEDEANDEIILHNTTDLKVTVFKVWPLVKFNDV